MPNNVCVCVLFMTRYYVGEAKGGNCRYNLPHEEPEKNQSYDLTYICLSDRGWSPEYYNMHIINTDHVSMLTYCPPAKLADNKGS